MSNKFLQTKKTTLSYSISDSETTIRLTALLKLDGTSISASDIGDYMTGSFDPGTSKEEIFSIASSGVTVNADGTVDITGVVRGLKEVDPYTTGGYSAEHGAGAVVVFSNNPQLYNQMANKSNDNTFTGQNIFNSFAPQTNTDPVAGNDLTRLSYVQALVLGTLTTINVIVPATAGATITIGQLVYFDETDNEWKLCDADTATTVQNVLLGIAQGSGTDGNPILNGVLLQGVDENQSGLTQGDVQYASNTAGSISSTPGTTEVTVGIAKSATELYFAPRFNQTLTEEQQDGLETVTPLSTANRAMTQKDLQIGAVVYGADAGSNDTYVITLPVAPTAYVAGMVVHFKANTVNTGAATLNVNSLGAIAIVKGLSTTLADGDIAAGMFCTVIYDGTNFVLQNPTNSPKSSNGSFSMSSSATTTITLGYRPKKITLHSSYAPGSGWTNGIAYSNGGYDASTGTMWNNYLGTDTNGGLSQGATTTSTALLMSFGTGGAGVTSAIINNITDTGFDIVVTRAAALTYTCLWTAIG